MKLCYMRHRSIVARSLNKYQYLPGGKVVTHFPRLYHDFADDGELRRAFRVVDDQSVCTGEPLFHVTQVKPL